MRTIATIAVVFVALLAAGCGGGSFSACVTDAGAKLVEGSDDLSFMDDNIKSNENVGLDNYAVTDDVDVLVVRTGDEGEAFAFEQARGGTGVSPKSVVRNPFQGGTLGSVYAVGDATPQALGDCAEDSDEL